MEDRIIAVNTNSYHGYDIEDALNGIAEAGFHYVELTATKGWTEHVFPDNSFERLVYIKNKMVELDLIPLGFSGHCNIMDNNRLNDFILNIELAHFFGSKYIVTSIGEAHLENGTEKTIEDIVNNIKILTEYMKKYDMALVLECHGEYSRGEELKEIIDKVDSQYVGINYDTANVIYYGNTRPEEDIKKCVDEIKYMHIKDKSGNYNEWNFPALGKGNIDFKDIFNTLKEFNNNCPCSIEIEFTEKGSRNLDEVNLALKDSAKYLKSIGIKI